MQIDAGPIGPVMGAIRARLDSWLGKPRSKRGQGRVTLQYRFDSQLLPAGQRRLKIEINTREHFSVLGLNHRPFEVSNPWFNRSALVTVYRIEELLGTKLRALYQRKKGRDLFDLARALDLPEVDPGRVIQCFQRYMSESGLSVSRAQFESNLEAKRTLAEFREDVEQLLPMNVVWNFDAAMDAVLSQIVALLPGEPWRGDGGAA